MRISLQRWTQPEIEVGATRYRQLVSLPPDLPLANVGPCLELPLANVGPCLNLFPNKQRKARRQLNQPIETKSSVLEFQGQRHSATVASKSEALRRNKILLKVRESKKAVTV
uniref:Uncharacterized protein n=1 Tax=Timema shepardi TaxID=629360 RepID=A0A7R9AY92_TIMSH|nr:unnamed protein product [Timema shepardi]